MRPEFPVFLSDHDTVAALEQRADAVLSAMRERGIGRVDDKKTVHYCGLVHHPQKGAVFFLPREARTGNPNIDLQTASLTMGALARFGAETSKRDFEDHGEAGNPSALSVIKRLAEDFRDHGLFSERIRRQTVNTGKPNWARTVTKEIPILSNTGQPIYADIRTSNAVNSRDALLAQIQAAIIREIHSAHAWWLSGTSSRRQELLSCSRPPFPRTTWASKLDALLPSLYSARSMKLAKYLRDYLRDTRKSSDGAFVFGVGDFHTVWETMLRETLARSPKDTYRQWNAELPRPVYIHHNHGKRDPRSRGMQTDIILEDDKGYTIVDAKYYGAKSAETAPDWPDIAKQIFYEKALREVLDKEGKHASNVQNIFAFPSRDGDGPLSFSEIQHRNGDPTTDVFPSIKCAYLSVSEVLACYVAGSKEIALKVGAKRHN